MEAVYFKDLGQMDYKTAWDYQERLLRENVEVKSRKMAGKRSEPAAMNASLEAIASANARNGSGSMPTEKAPRQAAYLAPADPGSDTTRHSLLFVEHPPVYTLGKSGKIAHILISEAERIARGIEFFYSNRGGDITFHGPQQLVGYPILDLEKFYTDIGRYLRNLEEVMIRTLAEYGLQGERSAGETGVWLDPGIRGKERKIGAIGVRCSRWITMHGFAFNVNTDLAYFNNIIPCGIENKQVTSLAAELQQPVSFAEVKEKIKRNFEQVFQVELVS